MANAMALKANKANKANKKAPLPVELYRSAIGKKYVMAVTGLFLTLFVLGHMAGNLKMYLGSMGGGEFAYHIDEYGHFLRSLGEPILPYGVFLWITRLALIGAFALHMHAAYSLTMTNRRARTVNYATKSDYHAANFASRSMRYTGTIVILYLIWHIMDLTWGVGNGSFRRGDVLNNVDSSLSRAVLDAGHPIGALEDHPSVPNDGHLKPRDSPLSHLGFQKPVDAGALGHQIGAGRQGERCQQDSTHDSHIE